MEKNRKEVERVWRERIEAQRLSGRTVGVFCKEAGFSEWAFYAWKRKLKVSASRFIAMSGKGLEKEVRIELPNGVRIDLGGGLESEGVRVFLRELCGMREGVGHARP